MYVLDTNAFYYAAGISECTYNVEKLRKLIKDNEVFLSTTSLFEFLIKYQGDIETVRLGGRFLWENHIRLASNVINPLPEHFVDDLINITEAQLQLMCADHIREYRYVYGAIEPLTGEGHFLIMPNCDSGCMNVFLSTLSKIYPNDRILLCCDGAAWHKSAKLDIPDNIRLFFIPPYTPEMNPIEQIWKDIRPEVFGIKYFLP